MVTSLAMDFVYSNTLHLWIFLNPLPILSPLVHLLARVMRYNKFDLTYQVENIANPTTLLATPLDLSRPELVS